MEYYKEKPFIHLFQTPLGNYFYDVNTNEIVKIDLKTYEYLNGEVNNETDEIRKKLYDLEMNGYLKKKPCRNNQNIRLLIFYHFMQQIKLDSLFYK